MSQRHLRNSSGFIRTFIRRSMTGSAKDDFHGYLDSWNSIGGCNRQVDLIFDFGGRHLAPTTGLKRIW